MAKNFKQSQNAIPNIVTGSQVFQTSQDTPLQFVTVSFSFQLEEKIQVDKVYIKYENPSEGKTQYQLKQMNFQNKQNQMNIYTVELQLDYQHYKYQYMIEKNQRTVSELNFRNFQYPKNQFSQLNENKIDEWNKVWCRYKINSKQQKWIKNYNIFLQKNDDTQLQFQKSTRLLFMYECSERIQNENNQIPRKIKLLDKNTNCEFDMKKLSIETRQSYFMNQIDIEFKIDEKQEVKIVLSQEAYQKLNNLIIANAEKEQDCQNQQKIYENLVRDQIALQNLRKDNETNYQNLFNIERDQIDSLKYKIEQVNREIQQFQIQIEQDKENNKIIRQESLKRMHMEYEEQKQKLQNEFLKFQQSLDQDIKDFQQQADSMLNKYKYDYEQYQCQLLQQVNEQQVKSLSSQKNQMSQIDETLLSDDIKQKLQVYRDKIDNLLQQNEDIDFQQNKQKEKNQIFLKNKLENLEKQLNESQIILKDIQEQLMEKQQEQENFKQKNEKLNDQISAVMMKVKNQNTEFEKQQQKLREIKEQHERANEQNKQLEEQIEKQKVDNEQKMKQFQEQINQQKKKFEQESQKRLQELEQKQKNEKQIQQQTFENFNKIQLQQFAHFKQYIKVNLLQDFYQLQIQLSEKICQCYSEEIRDFIKDELAELRTKLFQCGEQIQHLDSNQFDDIKKQSSQYNEILDRIIRQMNENPTDNRFQELFQSVYQFQLLSDNIRQIQENDLSEDDIEKVNKINQQIQQLDQGKHKIKSLISSIISVNGELIILNDSANESQQNLDQEFDKYINRLRELIETNIEQ